MLQADKAQHPVFRSARLAAFAAFYSWIIGGECTPNRTPSVEAARSQAPAAAKGIFEAFSGESISKQDFESSLTDLQNNICLSLAQPLKNIVDGLLTRDTDSKKSVLDELYDCLDADHDGCLKMDEVTKACRTIENVKIDLDAPLPDEFKFSPRTPFNQRLQDFLRENRENLQTSRFFIKLFKDD